MKAKNEIDAIVNQLRENGADLEKVRLKLRAACDKMERENAARKARQSQAIPA